MAEISDRDKNTDAGLDDQVNARDPLKVLESITEEQDEALVDYAGNWASPTMKGEPDYQGVRSVVDSLYRKIKLDPPGVLWCESPWQFVNMVAMLRLNDIAFDTDIYQRVRRQLQSPMWTRLFTSLDRQMKELLTSADRSASLNALFGCDVSTEVRSEVNQKITELQKRFEDQLSIAVKLRLREVFRAGRRERGLFGWNNQQMIRSSFGLLNLSAIVGDAPRQDFLSAISADLKTAINDICAARIKEDPTLFGFTAQKEEPIEKLFATANDSLDTPAGIPYIQEIAFIVKYLDVEVPDELKEPVLHWLTLKENVYHVQERERLYLICRRPVKAVLNARNQLHNTTGAAMEFADGCRVYAWNGVVLPREAIESSQAISVEQIEKELNVEVRRILIQQYGMERYLQDSGAVQIDADEYGVLYRKAQIGDEPVVVVRVLNPTPEPDGSHKFYFLRVPPYMSSAKAAVAWTFNMSPDEYQPADQS